LQPKFLSFFSTSRIWSYALALPQDQFRLVGANAILYVAGQCKKFKTFQGRMGTPDATATMPFDRGPNKWLDAAVGTLIAEGLDAVRIDRLARRLHITRGSFYHHYKDRDDLLRALLNHYVQTNHNNLVAMLPMLKGTPKDKLWVLWSATASKEFRDYDWAVRMWGMRDPHVAAVLTKIDIKRMEVLIGLFVELGFGKDEAWIRAALAYHGSLGDRAFFGPFPPMAKRLEWRRIALEILCRDNGASPRDPRRSGRAHK